MTSRRRSGAGRRRAGRPPPPRSARRGTSRPSPRRASHGRARNAQTLDSAGRARGGSADGRAPARSGSRGLPDRGADRSGLDRLRLLGGGRRAQAARRAEGDAARARARRALPRALPARVAHGGRARAPAHRPDPRRRREPTACCSWRCATSAGATSPACSTASGAWSRSARSRICGQVAAALDAAHAHDLVHRDVKPGNVLLAREAEGDYAYLCDFGLAKHGASVTSLTGARDIVGTVGYLSPEQIDGLPVDGRTDVYALGCVLFECLTGEPPYVRENELATILAHRSEPPPEVTDRRPELPEGLDVVMERALAKDREARYQSAASWSARRAARSRARRSSRRRRAADGGPALHTFVFADIRGYTAYMREHGDEEGARVAQRLAAAVEQLAPEHGGSAPRLRGDEALVIFDSARGALRYALGAAAAARGRRPAARRRDRARRGRGGGRRGGPARRRAQPGGAAVLAGEGGRGARDRRRRAPRGAVRRGALRAPPARAAEGLRPAGRHRRGPSRRHGAEPRAAAAARPQAARAPSAGAARRGGGARRRGGGAAAGARLRRRRR